MKTVIVRWAVENRVVPNADDADHFNVGLGTSEFHVPLSGREHTFSNVAPGTYSGFVSCVNANDVDMAPPAIFSVVVPDDATAPIPVNVTLTVL